MRTMMMSGFVFLAATLFALTASTATAAPIAIGSHNVRPASGTAGQLGTLQTDLNAIYGCAGCVDAYTDQNAAGMWGLIGTSFGSTTDSLQFKSGAFSSDNFFGIWSGTEFDPVAGTSDIVTVNVFQPGVAQQSIATLFWLAGDPNTLHITCFGTSCTGVNTGDFAGINRYSFGFFEHNGDGGTTGFMHNFWSVDQLNSTGPYNPAEMLAYQGPANIWTLAFEDCPQCGDFGHEDLVVSAGSLTAVPEPGSMALFGTGLIWVAGAARRRLKK